MDASNRVGWLAQQNCPLANRRPEELTKVLGLGGREDVLGEEVAEARRQNEQEQHIPLNHSMNLRPLPAQMRTAPGFKAEMADDDRDLVRPRTRTNQSKSPDQNRAATMAAIMSSGQNVRSRSISPSMRDCHINRARTTNVNM